MKEINLSSGDYLFVEVFDDATDFHYDSWFTRYINHTKGSIKLDVNTEIISTTKDITEEQSIKLVENHKYPSVITYRDYMFLHDTDDYEKEHLYDYFTAKESLQSLLQANKLEIDKNYLILLKQ